MSTVIDTVLGLTPRAGRARELFEAKGIPTTKDEEWKYTPLHVLNEATWKAGEAFLPSEVWGSLDPIRLVFANGFLVPSLSRGLDTPGLEVLDSSVAGSVALLEAQSFDVAAHLGRLAKPEVHAFGALNAATTTDGAYLRITGQIERPIVLAFVSSGEGVSSSPRVYIHAVAGSQATVFETYECQGLTRAFTNAVTEVVVESNAVLEHVKLQDESLRSVTIGLTEVKQEQDSTYRNYTICLGSRITRNDLNVFVGGENCHTRIDAVVCPDGDQHMDNHTRLDHVMPNCESFEVYKHLLNGNSTAVFNGKIFVHQDAQKTDAKQTNQAVLLSPTATMNTKPQLEIFADDVKCTHGATVGSLEHIMEFYMRSRGIPAVQARALLVYAYAAEVIEQISHDGIKEALEKRLLAKLGTEQV